MLDNVGHVLDHFEGEYWQGAREGYRKTFLIK